MVRAAVMIVAMVRLPSVAYRVRARTTLSSLVVTLRLYETEREFFLDVDVDLGPPCTGTERVLERDFGGVQTPLRHR